MSDFVGGIEREVLSGIAHLLPERWKAVVDLIDAPVPKTPGATVPAPEDPAAARLSAIDHIVVVMLENRSFDHMLGYLSLPLELGGRGRSDLDGLRGPEVNVNSYDGAAYPIHHLPARKFKDETEDPDHSGPSVDEQLADDCGGFVRNFARISRLRAEGKDEAPPEPGLVMGYYDGDDLPVFDHLAAEYCVVDRWFSSVPGATWPNRLYAMTGRSAGTREDRSPPIYQLSSFPRYLDERGVDWRWYSFDPATLRMADPAYRLGDHHRFAFVDSRTLSWEEKLVGEALEEGPSFLDVATGRLPAVSWIDPHFKDPGVLGPNSNDDHPPSDLAAGQDLVLRIFHALRSSPSWERTLLIVTYDEHGGFYDHVSPPAAANDEDPQFDRLGVRVPALLASPLITPGSVSSSLLGPEVHFDHTSIIKTILTRFCSRDGQIPAISARVQAANHLGLLLAEGPPRSAPPNHAAVAGAINAWQQKWLDARFDDPVAKGGPPGKLTDFQNGFYTVARLLRRAGLPAGRP